MLRGTHMNRTKDLQEFLDDLTPQQRQQLANATPQDWIQAINDCVNDPEFWKQMGEAFLQGVTRGLNEFMNETR